MTPEWSTACLDWQERIVDGRPLVPFAPLFQSEADAALNDFLDLKIVDAIGAPRFGDSSRPWVLDFVGSIFGAYDPVRHARLIREFFLCISKKNGKSTDAAAIMLTALIQNGRRSAEFLILAPTIEIARNSFEPARDMVRAGMLTAEGVEVPLDVNAGGFLRVQENVKTITDTRTNSVLKVVAADNEAVSGKKATGVLVDELWLFGKRANAENMLREATGGLVSRPEGFVVYLTTQSDEPPAGIFKQKLDYFRAVRDGKVVDPRSLPVIYEFPDEMRRDGSYMEPHNWRITNPNLGLSVSEEWLEDELRKAKESGKASLAVFLAKHLNIEIDQGLRADGWPGAEFWKQAEIVLTLDDLLERCEVVTIGGDGGGLDDLFGLCVLGREKESGNWLAWVKCWAHDKVLDRRKSEASKLRDFERDGDLVISEKVGTDFDEAVAIIKKCWDSGLLSMVGLDSAGIASFVDAINMAIFGEAEVPEGQDPIAVAVPQGYQLQAASKGCERKLADGTLYHAKQPIMDWMVGNAKMEMRGNAVHVTKAASGTAKIDGLMALFDAAFLMARNPKPRGSIYGPDRGLLIIG